MFGEKKSLNPKMMVWRTNVYGLKSIHHYPMIWHVNCVWFFEKSSQENVWLNKPLFTKIVIFFLKITDPWISFIGNFKPRVHPNICQERKVLSCMLLEKTSWQFFSVLAKMQIFTPKWWYGDTEQDTGMDTEITGV